MKDLVLKLRELRRHANLTQRDLARQSGVGEKTISSLETGQRIQSLKVEQLRRILKACGTSEAEFYGWKFAEPSEDPEHERIQRLVGDVEAIIDPERKERVLRSWWIVVEQARQSERRGLRLVGGAA